jgi:hypothetical protein
MAGADQKKSDMNPVLDKDCARDRDKAQWVGKQYIGGEEVKKDAADDVEPA